jgi:hypothetical protein
MTRRFPRVIRRCTVACLLSAPLGLAFAACSSSSRSTKPDAGARDAAGDHTADALNDGSAKPSCAVDAGALMDAEIALGFGVVNSRGCFNCHGGALQGNNDGVLSTVDGGFAYPPNLTPDPTTGLGCWTNAQIKNAFLNGFDNQDAALCNPMPHFGHLAEGGINDAQATSIVQFLRSLPAQVNNVPDTPTCAAPDWDASADVGIDGATEATTDAGRDATETADAANDSGHDTGGATDGSARDSTTPDATHDATTPDAARDAATPDGERDASIPSDASGDAATRLLDGSPG